MERDEKTSTSENDEALTDEELEEAAGGSGRRRAELDHVGNYNFTVEISGVQSGGGDTLKRSNRG